MKREYIHTKNTDGLLSLSCNLLVTKLLNVFKQLITHSSKQVEIFMIKILRSVQIQPKSIQPCNEIIHSKFKIKIISF